MGTTHFDNVSGINGVYVGKKGSEVAVASSTGQLYQSGAAVTSSAAEINIMDGVTATAAELNLIDGSIAGTAVASKALSLGASKNVDVLAVADLKLGAGAGTSVTSTAAELNALAGVTAGTVAASKAVVVDANKRADALTIGTLSLGAGAGTAIVPAAAQINLLAQGVAAGYKIARGVTAIGAASVDVVTGLTTVIAVAPGMVGDPSLTHMYSSATVGDQAGAPAAGSIRIKSWKPTSAADCTPVAATSPFANVGWIAIGT